MVLLVDGLPRVRGPTATSRRSTPERTTSSALCSPPDAVFLPPNGTTLKEPDEIARFYREFLSTIRPTVRIARFFEDGARRCSSFPHPPSIVRRSSSAPSTT